MIKLIRHLKGYYAVAGAGLFLKFAEAIFDLIFPLIVASVIDIGVANRSSSYILQRSLALFALTLLGFAFSVTCQYFAARASCGFGTNLRNKLYSHINTLSCSDLDRLGTPSLITRITADVNNMQQSVNMFIRLATRAPFMLIGSISIAMLINVRLSLIFLATSVLVALALFLVMVKTLPFYKRANKQLDRVSLLTRENIVGTRVVRAFSMQKKETVRFSDECQALSKTSKAAAIISALMTPLSFGIVNIGIVLLIHFGSLSVNSGSLSQGEVVALTNYMVHIFYSLTIIATLSVIFAKGSASGKRIRKVLDTKQSISYGEISSFMEQEGTADNFPSSPPLVEFKNVSFSYAENAAPSLSNVSFTLNRGETLGIIGRTGSGKSSITNLLQRFYDIEEGEILLSGHPITSLSSPFLRSLISVVPQTPVLFSGTVRENLTLGNLDASDTELFAALKIAQAEGFINKLAGQLDGRVIKGGKNFSGGQRQRLTIARALVKKSPILVLDDAYSSLDFATEAKLRGAIKKTQSERAVIIISQRAPSIMLADKILVLENGHMAGYGTHSQLIESCDIYKEIFQSQTDN